MNTSYVNRNLVNNYFFFITINLLPLKVSKYVQLRHLLSFLLKEILPYYLL